MAQAKTRYQMQCQTDGGRWEDGDGIYKTLAEAREELTDMRNEFEDEPGKPIYRHRLVQLTITAEVLKD